MQNYIGVSELSLFFFL